MRKTSPRFIFAALAAFAVGVFAVNASAQCANTCPYAADGECDDGGPGALNSLCPLGSDCTDCGPRGTGGICSDSCQYAGDGECDDGGPGSLNSLCPFGSDCADCGVRTGSAPAPTPTPTPTPTAAGCTNACTYAYDGDCDDGGPGADTSLCSFGTDCGDCGPRSGMPTRGVCTNTCQWAADGECDDGGPGSINDLCGFGTDCTDCGPR